MERALYQISIIIIIIIKGGVIYIYSVYLPAQGSGEDYNTVLDDLTEIIENREDRSSYIICGDTNADMGYLGGPRCTREPSRQGVTLSRFVEEFGLVVGNCRTEARGPIETYVGPTGSSTIDHIMVSADLEHEIISCRTSDDNALNTSDHRMVSMALNVGNVKRVRGDPKGGKLLRWDKLSNDEIREKYTVPLEFDLLPLIETMQKVEVDETMVDKCFDDMVRCVSKRGKAIPTSRFRKNIRPYWNERLTQLKKDKIRKHSNWVNQGKPRIQGDIYWEEHKQARKMFTKELRKLHKEYENDSVTQVINAAEIDRGCFWKLVKKSRGNSGNKANSIKNKQGKVVNDTEDVLRVWMQHFGDLHTPKQDADFDREHFDFVTERVKRWNEGNEIDDFSRDKFTEDEVKRAVNKLHKKKASGYDGVSTEHIIHAGEFMITLLTLLYNHIVKLEYIPVNLCRGTQVPLYKGKKACSLDTDSYRGITLLTNYNKIYKILVWDRVKDWWEENSVISDLQGAGRKRQSCIHTALMLQESIP